MIVDEVQTGVAVSGTFWAHEQWNLESPPDFVTFAKKMISSGFYHTDETKMVTPMRHHNTFYGDPVRAIMTMAQNQVIKEDNLVQNCKTTGKYLLDEMHQLSAKYPKLVGTPRGLGLQQAFDVVDAPTRAALLKNLKVQGINSGPISASSIRIRPTLYFEKKHADLYIDRLSKACKNMQ